MQTPDVKVPLLSREKLQPPGTECGSGTGSQRGPCRLPLVPSPSDAWDRRTGLHLPGRGVRQVWRCPPLGAKGVQRPLWATPSLNFRARESPQARHRRGACARRRSQPGGLGDGRAPVPAPGVWGSLTTSWERTSHRPAVASWLSSHPSRGPLPSSRCPQAWHPLPRHLPRHVRSPLQHHGDAGVPAATQPPRTRGGDRGARAVALLHVLAVSPRSLLKSRRLLCPSRPWGFLSGPPTPCPPLSLCHLPLCLSTAGAVRICCSGTLGRQAFLTCRVSCPRAASRVSPLRAGLMVPEPLRLARGPLHAGRAGRGALTGGEPAGLTRAAVRGASSRLSTPEAGVPGLVGPFPPPRPRSLSGGG